MAALKADTASGKFLSAKKALPLFLSSSALITDLRRGKDQFLTARRMIYSCHHAEHKISFFRHKFHVGKNPMISDGTCE
jgi:hypothetical protein